MKRPHLISPARCSRPRLSLDWSAHRYPRRAWGWRWAERGVSVVEDDGALIIRKQKIRVVFSIGQDRPLREQNERMKAVLEKLGLMKHACVYVLHSDAAIEEEENEDDECQCCGQPRH